MIPGERPSNLLDVTISRFPALARYGDRLAFRQSPPDPLRQSEFYPPGETGSFAPGKAAVEAFGQQAPRDIAGEVVSHYLARGPDKVLTGAYNKFKGSLDVAQIMRLHQQYQWARNHEGERRPYARWAEVSGIPAYFRGYTFGQWPNAQSFYTAPQLQVLDSVRSYLKGGGGTERSLQGVHPLRYAEHAAQAVGHAATDAVTYIHDYDPFRKPPSRIYPTEPPKKPHKPLLGGNRG